MDFKRLLNIGNSRVLGLDIGDSSVKVVGLRKDNGSYVVTAAAMAEIAPYQFGDAQRKKANTVKAVRKCLDSADARTRLVVCGLNGPEVAVRDFEFPAISPGELEGAVALEASQICPFNTEDGRIDYQLTPDGDNKIKGVLVAATNSLVKNRLQITKEASLDCAMMDVDGLALLNCFSEFEKPAPGQARHGLAILNIGSAHATLAIMRENGRPFVRDMTYAGNAIINEIASEVGLPIETVVETLSGQSAEPQHDLSDSLEKASKRLADEVATTSRYYKTQDKGAGFDTIFLCGGFALIKGLAQSLQTQLAAKVVPWNPFEKLRCEPVSRRCATATRQLLQSKGPALAVAAGLALRSA